MEPKSQCRSCLTYWDAGIVYCTCGHLMEDDTTENKKYISSVLDLFSIPNFYIRKGRPHGHRYGKKEGCKEVHTAKQLQRRCRKKHYENIHDRFIRDKFFRKTMIELGRSEEIILEMDRLASEDHSHIATQEEIDVCQRCSAALPWIQCARRDHPRCVPSPGVCQAASSNGSCGPNSSRRTGDHHQS